MTLVLWIAIFALSLAALVWSSGRFVEAAQRVGPSLGISPFVVGVVIVGVGTSLPELASSLMAALAGSSEIVVGNVVGSNISNILLVLGAAMVTAREMRIHHDLMHIDLPVLLASSLFLGLMLMDGEFSRGESLLCLACLGIYIVGSIRTRRAAQVGPAPLAATPAAWLWLLLSPIGVFLGAKYAVDAIVRIADLLQIGTEVIALSAVALGTSLPEVVVSITSARRGEPEMAAGNIIGSNIFNALGVMSIPSLIAAPVIPASVVSFSLPVLVASTILFVVVTVDRRLNRTLGLMMLAFYGFFLGRLFGWL